MALVTSSSRTLGHEEPLVQFQSLCLILCAGWIHSIWRGQEVLFQQHWSVRESMCILLHMRCCGEEDVLFLQEWYDYDPDMQQPVSITELEFRLVKA